MSIYSPFEAIVQESSTKVNPYVYVCIHKETKEFYIGSRTTKNLNKPSHIDFPNYKSSSKKVNPRFDEFYWYIVAEFFNPLDAYDYEHELIYEYWSHPLMLNKSCYHGKKRMRRHNTDPYFNKTEEEKQEIIDRGIATKKNKPEEERQITRERMKAVYTNRTQEENDVILKKIRDTKNNKTEEEKKASIQKRINTNNSKTDTEKRITQERRVESWVASMNAKSDEDKRKSIDKQQQTNALKSNEELALIAQKRADGIKLYYASASEDKLAETVEKSKATKLAKSEEEKAETRRKQSEANKGKRHSQESYARASQTRIERNKNKLKFGVRVCIDNICFTCIEYASEFLGIKYGVVYSRLHNPNFQNYNILFSE